MTTGRSVRVAASSRRPAVLALMLDGRQRRSAAPARRKKRKYPNATRSAPKNGSDQRQRTEDVCRKDLDAPNCRATTTRPQQQLQKVLDSSKSKYAKASRCIGLANLKFNANDYPGAIAYYKQLFELNSVSNDAVFRFACTTSPPPTLQAEQYQAALDEIKQWREQGKRETADSYALEGNIYYRTAEIPEAIAAISKRSR